MAEYADSRALSLAEQAAIRQAAAMILRAEQLQAAVVNGEGVDSGTLIRIASEARRLLASLRKRGSHQKARAPSMRERLAIEAEDAA